MAKAGAPLKYKTPELMQEAIDRYFAECKGTPYLDDKGKQVFDKFNSPVILNARPPTIMGLAVMLGLTRQGLLQYQGYKAFTTIVEQAKARVEQYAEERLFDRDGERGAEYSLTHNFKWQGQNTTNGNGVLEGILEQLKNGHEDQP